MKEGKVYRVAVYYPDGWEKYGGVTEFPTKEKALAHKATLLAMRHKAVKVWSVTTKEIDE